MKFSCENGELVYSGISENKQKKYFSIFQDGEIPQLCKLLEKNTLIPPAPASSVMGVFSLN